MEDESARGNAERGRETWCAAKCESRKPGHELQTAANAERKNAKSAVELFVAVDVFTFVNNVSEFGTFLNCGYCLLKHLHTLSRSCL